MDTKEIIIEEDTLEMAKQYSARTGRSLDEILDKYIYFNTEGYKEFQNNVSPDILEIRRLISSYIDKSQ